DFDLHLRPHPVDIRAWQPRSLREGRLLGRERLEPLTQFDKHSRVEPGPHLTIEDEVVAFEVPDEEGTQANPRPPGFGKATDHEGLLHLTLHLQPVPGTLRFVRR